MTQKQAPPPLPTPAELNILRHLWNAGPSTVREVHDGLAKSKRVRYTSVLRQLQNMYAKGLVIRDDSARSHVYASAVDAEATETRLLRRLLDTAFDGSTSRLVLRAFAETPPDPDEIAEIRAILDRVEDR